MIDFKSKPKVEIRWNVNPYDYSQEAQENILEKFSTKYNIPKEVIKIVPCFTSVTEDGEEISLAKDIISDINDVRFQLSLFKEYIKISGIEDVNFDLIEKIDAEVNDKIDFNKFVSHKRFSLKWIKWSNFLSYGEDNFFDFTKLNGLILLHGESPYQNQSGKTTFAIDLSHFLFFGRTTKTENLMQIFNNKLKEATEVYVEGCVEIEGNEYVIKRTIIRPAFKKRTVKSKAVQKVSYYKKINDSLEELEDYEEQNGESVKATNKIIKEAIGNEQDYDLMLCATSDNLDDLISMKDTERGRLLSRWIGLSLLEEKDVIARGKFNNEIKSKLLSNLYNRETLKKEIELLTEDIEKKNKEIKNNIKEIKNIEKDIETFETNKKALLESKSNVDSSLMKVDVTTIESRLEDIKKEGTIKRQELELIKSKIAEIGDIQFSMNEYKEKQELKNKLSIEMTEYRSEYKSNKKLIEQLTTSEYCPTCGRKYDNVDNSGKINEIRERNNQIYAKAEKLNESIQNLSKEIEEMSLIQEKVNEKNKLVVKSSAIELKIEQLLSEHKEKKNLKKEYDKNVEAIKKNNELDISLRNIDINLSKKREEKDLLNNTITYNKSIISNNDSEIDKRKTIIQKIEEEAEWLKNWKIYLEMVGKNGISKMVLKRALPIINADLASMLSDVCDFTISIEMTDKQEVIFYLIRDGIKSNLNSGSGFEMTCASLALRSVLAKMNTLSKNDGLILDEILGRVASSNYDNMLLLYKKILNDYRYIIQVTHIDEVKDWHNTILCVSKENGISKIKFEK